MNTETTNGDRTANQLLNRQFLLAAILLLGLLILSSLSVIFLILTDPQSNLSAFQAATATPTHAVRSVETSATPTTSVAPATLAPSVTATPELESIPDSEEIVDYPQSSERAHRIIRYSGQLVGTHRIVSYDGVVIQGPPTPEGSGDRAVELRQGRIIFYGNGQ